MGDTEIGELGSYLTESKNESCGQRRMSKALGVLLRKDTEKKKLSGVSSQVCHQGLLGLIFHRKLTKNFNLFDFSTDGTTD